MCDVDFEAVATAKDAPTHLRHPQGAAHRGSGRLPRPAAGPAVPRRRLDRVGRPAEARAPPGARGRGRAGRQVHRPAGRVPVGDRGAARRRLRAGRPREASAGWPSDTCETPEGARKELAGVDAVCVPGGFGVRGIEGKLGALRWARENQVPTLGLCLGLQCMVIEFARNVVGLDGASSSRVRPRHRRPGDRDDGRAEGDRRGRRRHGRHDAARAVPGRAGARLPGRRRRTARSPVSERHRHRYEVNNSYRDAARGRRAGHLRPVARTARSSSSSS